MKIIPQLIITLAIFCTSIPAFALNAPVLTVNTSGLDVTASWSSVSGATGYTFHYAQYPYEGVHTIGSANMGASASFSVTLWDGASYYVAVTAIDESSESEYSNIELFTISGGIAKPAPFICGDNLDCNNYEATVEAMELMVDYLAQVGSNNIGACEGSLRSVESSETNWPGLPLAPKEVWIESCNRCVINPHI